MEKQITFWLGAVLLWAALDCSQAQVIPSYFVVGGNLVLRPTGTGAITNILWKYNGNLLAEWVQREVNLTYYDKYEGRTTLDPVSGRLEVTNMNKADGGSYTVEINNKVHGQSYTVKAISKVPKPSVALRTLTCSHTLESCRLSCDDENSEFVKAAEPIEYSWKMGEGEWKKMGYNFTITSDETRHVKTFSCRMKNPVSQEDSEPFNNPKYEEPVHPESGSGLIAGIIVGVIVALVVVVVVFALLRKFKPDLIARLIPQCGSSADPESGNKGHQLDPAPTSTSPGDQPNSSPEAEPLKTPDPSTDPRSSQ